MAEKLEFELIFSEFDEKLGPMPFCSYPETEKEFGMDVAMKSINLLIGDEASDSTSLAFLPFASQAKKGIVQNIEWPDGTARGGIGSGSLTLIFNEADDLIFYKYIKDLEIVFEKAAEKIIDLKTSKVGNEVFFNELKKIHESFENRLQELSSQETGATDDSKAFPEEADPDTEDRYSFKVVVCGDPACGKTSTILRFTDRAFRRTYLPTMGVNITGKDVNLEGSKIHLVLWDLAGQVKFNYIRRQLYMGARAIFLIFDLTRPKTFKSIPNWLDDIRSNLRQKEEPVALLCGNKVDLKDQRNVTIEDAKKLASELNLEYFETSALTGENIDEAFHMIAKKLISDTE
jgi:small GTP-binding protein